MTQILKELRKAAPKATLVAVSLHNPFSGTGNPLEIAANFAISSFNGVVCGLASAEDVGASYADVFPKFVGKAREYIAGDGLHPNDEGYQAMAKVVLAAVKSGPPSSCLPAPLLPPNLDQGNGIGSAEPVTAEAPEGGGDGTDIAILLAIIVPSALAGAAIVAGAYLLGRGRS
ncbi:MAG: hypothetical protein HYS09_04160 [Chloroflexi bacterium]|nr:hypothetical protein [Chloroflexota bacterium]